MSFDGKEHTTRLFHKIKFYCASGKVFFLLSHFLVVEDNELSKSTSHLLSVLLSVHALRNLKH